MLVTYRTISRWVARLRARSAEQDGFALLEVILTTLFVGLIMAAMVSGYNGIGKATADERFHQEAALLASQSQEALRSDPASSLNALASSSHTYTQTVAGETFTITQSAQLLRGSGGGSTCSATASYESKQSGTYVQITSSVTWPQLGSKRPPVKQTSIITPPDGSTLEVDVTTVSEPVKAIEGVTVIANKESETTTGTGGCVLYAAIPSTTVSLEASKSGYVTEADSSVEKVGEVTIAPNVTTHHTITLAKGGSITGEFEYSGSKVEGDTFVVSNSELKASSTFEVGGTASSLAANHYGTTASTLVSEPSFPYGDLFAFKHAWIVYAGDCTSNEPATVTKSVVKGAEAIVEEGIKRTVKIPLSKLSLAVYSGKPSSPGKTESGPFQIKITNTKCSTAIPNNATEAHYVHEQEFTGGSLQHPYQPFGALELCLYNKASGDTYAQKVETTTVAGVSTNVYLGITKSEGGVTLKTGQTKC